MNSLSQPLPSENFRTRTILWETVELDSNIARTRFEIVLGSNMRFLLVRTIPLPATVRPKLFANAVIPGLPLVEGDRLFVANTYLEISNFAGGPGLDPIILVFSSDPDSFSAV